MQRQTEAFPVFWLHRVHSSSFDPSFRFACMCLHLIINNLDILAFECRRGCCHGCEHSHDRVSDATTAKAAQSQNRTSRRFRWAAVLLAWYLRHVPQSIILSRKACAGTNVTAVHTPGEGVLLEFCSISICATSSRQCVSLCLNFMPFSPFIQCH